MTSRKVVPILAVVIFLSVPLWAQQGQPQQQQSTGGAATPVQPISTRMDSGDSQGAVPTARGLFVSYDPNASGATAQVEPDDSLLSGVESFSLGVVHSLTTLFDPSVFVTESTSTGLVPGQWDSASSVGGGLGLVRDWNHSRIAAQYFGTQSFYSPDPSADGAYHALSVSQAFSTGRWSVLLRDDLLYTRTANFGNFQAGGIAPASGTGSGSSLQPGLGPSDTISTGQVGVLNEAFSSQIGYAVSRRTAISVGAVYGVLHFTDPGYINTQTMSVVVGYNYALSRVNSMALIYNYGQDSFNTSNGSAQSHALQGAFGRRITGKLALQTSAGPQVVLLRSTPGMPSHTTVSWTASAGFTYGPKPKHFSYSASYSHGFTGGSGVFQGAETDTVTGAVQISLRQAWSGSVTGGFASNNSLATTIVGASRYNNWYGSSSLSRSLGRQLIFSLSYEYQRQIGNGSCPVASCGLSPSSQSVSARLQWHPWPARIQ